MPELPEVETIASQLNKKIPGHMIRDVWSDWPKTLQVLRHNDHIKIKKTKTNVKRSEMQKMLLEFKKDILGKKIKNVKRKGKNVMINLSGDHVLLVHQKLSGHLLFGKWKIEKGKAVPLQKGILNDKINGYIHVILFLSGGNMLALSDLRKFAKMLLGPKKDIFALPEIAKLGPDPIKDKVSFKEFKDLIKKEKGPIKAVLLDQGVISGIGNIYSDEILWFSKVHPLKKAKDLKDAELKKMFDATKKILKFSIKLGGDSMSDFRNIYGKRGGYQDHHKVYQRKGKPCFKCKTKIERIVVGSRGTHFCPNCQKLKK